MARCSDKAMARCSDLIIAQNFLSSFARVLDLPKVPSVSELESDLAAMGPSSSYASIQLCEMLREELNEGGGRESRFPDGCRSTAWPEQARQLLMLAQAGVVGLLRSAEEGEEAREALKRRVQVWLRGQQSGKHSRQLLFILNSAYDSQPDGDAKVGDEANAKEGDEDEEGDGGQGMADEGAKDEDSEEESDGEETAAAIARGEGVAALDEEVKRAVWRALMAWAHRHRPTVMSSLIAKNSRGGGKRKRSSGGAASRRQKKARTSQRSEVRREYMEHLYGQLKVLSDKELPWKWASVVMWLLDTYHPLRIRETVQQAANEAAALSSSSFSSSSSPPQEGEGMLAEDLRSCVLLDDPLRSKEAAMRCLATAVSEAKAAGMVLLKKKKKRRAAQEEEEEVVVVVERVKEQEKEGAEQEGGDEAPTVDGPVPMDLAPSPQEEEQPGSGGAAAAAAPPAQDPASPSAMALASEGKPASAPPSPSTASCPSSAPSLQLEGSAGDVPAPPSTTGPTRVILRVSEPSPTKIILRLPSPNQAKASTALATDQQQPRPVVKELSDPEARVLMLRHARAIIRTLAQEEEYEHFRLPVDPAWVMDYKATVRRPIDLRAIDRKIAAKRYKDGAAIRADVQRIRDNAHVYNRYNTENAYLLDRADRLVAEFDRLWRLWVTDVLEGRGQGPSEEAIYLIAPWGEVCNVCHKDGDEELTLLCSGCEAEYHMYCLEPPLEQLPAHDEDFFCPHRCAAPPEVSEDDEDDQDDEERKKSSFGSLTGSAAQRLARLHPEPDLSLLGLTVLKDFGAVQHELWEGVLTDYSESAGYRVMYPEDNDREDLDDEELEWVRQESDAWASAIDALVLVRPRPSSKGEEDELRAWGTRKELRKEEGGGEEEEEEEEEEDPFGPHGCVPVAVRLLKSYSYDDMDVQDRATVLRALCEAAATTRALRDAYRHEVEGKGSDSSDEDDDDEEEEEGKKSGGAGGVAEKKEQEKQLPAFDHGGYATVGCLRGYVLPRWRALASDSQRGEYWLLPAGDCGSKLVVRRYVEGGWRVLDPACAEDCAAVSQLARRAPSLAADSAHRLALESLYSLSTQPNRPKQSKAPRRSAGLRASDALAANPDACKLLRCAASGYAARSSEPCPVCTETCVIRDPHATSRRSYRVHGGPYLTALRVLLLDLMEALPPLLLEEGPLQCPTLRSLWREFVESAANPHAVLQGLLILEHSVTAKWLPPWWRWHWSSPSTATRSATHQSVAHRLYSLQRALAGPIKKAAAAAAKAVADSDPES